MTNKNTVSDTVKIVPKVAPIGSSTGGISLTQKLTLLVDFANFDRSVLPRQVQLVLIALDGANGSCTMQDINKFYESSTDEFFWGTLNGVAYEQSPSKISGHYLARLLGQKEWSSKLGKIPVIKLG